MRTVLEDDLDIMVDLCKALVKLHPILIPLDFKSCGTAWKVYASFVKEYQERLAERLSQGVPSRCWQQQLWQTFETFTALLGERRRVLIIIFICSTIHRLE